MKRNFGVQHEYLTDSKLLLDSESDNYDALKYSTLFSIFSKLCVGIQRYLGCIKVPNTEVFYTYNVVLALRVKDGVQEE